MNPNASEAPLSKLASRNDLLKAWFSNVWRNELVRSVMGWALIICMAAWWLWPKGENKSDSAQSHILRVFQQDKAIAKEMEKKMGFKEKYWNASKVLAEWAEKMDAIDLNGCPRDFQAAYKKHVAAWKSMALFHSHNAGLTGFVKSFVTGGLSMVPAFSENEHISKELSSTFAELKQVAIRYGVAP